MHQYSSDDNNQRRGPDMTSQYTVINSASDLDRSAVRVKQWQPNTRIISDTNSLHGQTAVKLSQYRKK